MNSRINKLAGDILEWDGEWESLSVELEGWNERLDRFGDALASASRRSAGLAPRACSASRPKAAAAIAEPGR